MASTDTMTDSVLSSNKASTEVEMILSLMHSVQRRKATGSISKAVTILSEEERLALEPQSPSHGSKDSTMKSNSCGAGIAGISSWRRH